MGQTLTHGVYLPDEGERNCYSGLAANWQILDSSVGTIAEHSTQIAGKAPLVHTHTKADITDFPAYGTTAGTICEGNDSRLSDARTPVAHTHTKSDVTDLFNSANIWSALNSYSNGQIRIKSPSQEIGVIPSSGVIQYLEFADKNDAQHGIVGLWDYANGASEIQMYISDKFKNGAKDPTGTSETTILSFGFKTDGSKFLTFSGQVDNSVIPKSNNSYGLGSSSYQWNNLYAKSYYYNGVAWGLDKENIWTENNKFSKSVSPSDITGINSNTMAFSGLRSVIFFNTTGSSNRPSYGTFLYSGYSAGTAPDNYGQLQLLRSTDKKGETNNGLIPDTSFAMWRVAPHYLLIEFMNSVRVTNNGTENSLKPITNNATDLGTSTNKWKTLNGINPGALSLPSGGTTENTDWYNVAGDILPTGGNATDFNWGQNMFTPSKDGWLALTIKQCSSISVWCDTLKYGMSVAAPDASLNRQLIIPVVANMSYEIRISGNSWFSARLIMPKGNV